MHSAVVLLSWAHGTAVTSVLKSRALAPLISVAMHPGGYCAHELSVADMSTPSSALSATSQSVLLATIVTQAPERSQPLSVPDCPAGHELCSGKRRAPPLSGKDPVEVSVKVSAKLPSSSRISGRSAWKRTIEARDAEL